MILAIKSADFETSLLLLAPDGKRVRETAWESGRELSAQLLSKIQELMEHESAGVHDITGIIIFSGPGSFTSLRIGHSVAGALADSLGIPVVGADGDDWLASGLHALATAAPGRPALPNYGSEAHITRPRS